MMKPGDTTGLSLITNGLNTVGDPSPNFASEMSLSV